MSNRKSLTKQQCPLSRFKNINLFRLQFADLY